MKNLLRLVVAMLLIVCVYAQTTAGYHTVAPGQNHTNTDGVKVDNFKASNGDITITPKTGTVDSETTVTIKKDAKGEVSGLDANDVVIVQSDADVVIKGAGGTVEMKGSGGKAVITNTSETESLKVKYAGGGSGLIPPGGTFTALS